MVSIRKDFKNPYTLKLQWLENSWLVYHGYFGLVLEVLELFVFITAYINIFGIIRDLFFPS